MKILFIFIILFTVIPVRGQNCGDAPKSTLYVKTALYNYMSDYSVSFLPMTVEYDRRFAKNWSWVGGFAFTPYPMVSFIDDSGRAPYRSYALNAKIAVTTNRDRRVFVRFEMGFSAVIMTSMPTRAEVNELHRFIPSVIAELHLGIRLGKYMELLVSPLLITPSMYRFSPHRVMNRYPYYFHELNAGSLGLGVRF